MIFQVRRCLGEGARHLFAIAHHTQFFSWDENSDAKVLAVTANRYKQIFWPNAGTEEEAGTGMVVNLLSAKELHLLQEGELSLLVDFSYESFPADKEAFDGLYQGLRQAGVAGDRVTIVNGNILSEDAHRAYCTAQGLTSPCHFIGYDSFLFLFKIWLDEQLIPLPDDPLVYLRKRSEQADKSYLCLNRMPRAHRWAVVIALYQAGLESIGLLSFAGPTIQKRFSAVSTKSERRAVFEAEANAVVSCLNAHDLARFFCSDSLNETIDDVLSCCPIEIDDGFHRHVDDAAFALDSEPFTRTFFSIVTDTRFSEDAVLFLTEKIYKPMFFMHPFVYVGSPYALRHLKELGFKTFSPWIDERYDDEPRPFERLQLVLAEVERLARLPICEWRCMTVELYDILIHNHRCLTGPWKRYLQPFEAQVLTKTSHLRCRQ